ncbi:MAG TPA: helix-turn-helix domain-containing protein [Kofleriaceae bacterium]|jgi:AcrR family transcriptional regulator|nr:helix-turn-helix domain-containing protein [Kofleriaceae bacterium]
MTPGRKKASPVARRRDRERGQRRDSILRAAERVFADRGFAQTTMDQVAEAAELSKGTLYLYFKNKDDLFIGLSNCMIEQFLERFEAVLAEGGTGIDMVERMLRAYGELVAGNPDHFRTTVVWMVSGQEEDHSTPEFKAHRAKVSRLVGAMVEAMKRGQRDGSIRRDISVEQTAFQVWSGALGCMQIQVNRKQMMRRFPQPVDFDRFYPGFIRILCDGLRPPARSTPRRTR